jgi:hypothetical protein
MSVQGGRMSVQGEALCKKRKVMQNLPERLSIPPEGMLGQMQGLFFYCNEI